MKVSKINEPYEHNHNHKLRQQLVDVLKYLRSIGVRNYMLRRDKVIDRIDTINSDISVSLADLISLYSKYNPKDIIVTGYSEKDWDDYTTNMIDISLERYRTDSEYFEQLCSIPELRVSDYNKQQYDTYLRLKKMFEGE